MSLVNQLLLNFQIKVQLSQNESLQNQLVQVEVILLLIGMLLYFFLVKTIVRFIAHLMGLCLLLTKIWVLIGQPLTLLIVAVF